jgi:hypothetical protein
MFSAHGFRIRMPTGLISSQKSSTRFCKRWIFYSGNPTKNFERVDSFWNKQLHNLAYSTAISTYAWIRKIYACHAPKYLKYCTVQFSVRQATALCRGSFTCTYLIGLIFSIGLGAGVWSCMLRAVWQSLTLWFLVLPLSLFGRLVLIDFGGESRVGSCCN